MDLNIDFGTPKGAEAGRLARELIVARSTIPPITGDVSGDTTSEFGAALGRVFDDIKHDPELVVMLLGSLAGHAWMMTNTAIDVARRNESYIDDLTPHDLALRCLSTMATLRDGEGLVF